MTTIACNQNEMAADSLGGVGGRRTTVQKLYRVGGAIIGTSGAMDEGVMFAHWYANGADLADRPKGQDFGALVLDSSGIWRYEVKCYPFRIFDEFAVSGSGGDDALAAMLMGASPAEAVELACRVDLHTGPPIVVERLQDE